MKFIREVIVNTAAVIVGLVMFGYAYIVDDLRSQPPTKRR